MWESLASDESLAAWPMGPGLHLTLRSASPRPFGVGTTRELTFPYGALTFPERFSRWDEGEGYSSTARALRRADQPAGAAAVRGPSPACPRPASTRPRRMPACTGVHLPAEQVVVSARLHQLDPARSAGVWLNEHGYHVPSS